MKPLRVFCVEDNALLVMQLESIIEEGGHRFAGSAARFTDLEAAIGKVDFDVALVDIDLADGRTGGEVAAWLRKRGYPSLFVTGQENVAADYADVSLGIVGKPVEPDRLLRALREVARSIGRHA